MQQAITTEFKDLANNVKKVRHSILNDKDKREAKESYRNYLRQIEAIDKRTGRYFFIPKSAEGIKWCRENYFDWEHSHETEYYILYCIPYDDFCILRQIDDIEDLIDEYESRRLPLSEVEKHIKTIEKVAPELTEIIKVLKRALKYNTYVSFDEDHII